MRLSVKSALITSLTVAGAATVILLVVTHLMHNELRDAIWQQLDARLRLETQRIQANMDGVAADAVPIADGPSLREYLDSGRPGHDRKAARRTLEAVLASVAQSHPTYFQIRFIDAAGHERARVDRRDGRVLIVPQTELQDKSEYDYVRRMLALERGQAYISPLNLNREHGVVERPFIPTLRIAVPVFDDAGTRRGGVVINLDAREVILPRQIGAIRFLMVNEDGYFLLHSDPAKEFGFDLGQRTTVEAESPEAAAQLSAQSEGVLRLDHGLTTPEPELVLFRRFHYDPSDPDRTWRLIAAEPEAIAYAPIESLDRRLVYLVVGVAALACLIGWLAAYGIVKPIRAMAAVVQRITAGDLRATVNVRGSGEVALLGTAFNTMTGRLNALIRDEQKAREDLAESNQELRRSNGDLEQFAYAASHDLRTPLRAVAALREWIEADLATTESFSGDVREHLGEMGKQVDRMSRLLNDLLEYARMGKADSKIRHFDPAEVAFQALAVLQVPRTFTVEVAFEHQTISAAPVEFELVVRNLVDNAVKHHDRNTGAIRLSGRYRGDALIVEVSDDGPGIPPRFHAQVLKAFSSLRRRDEYEGSGLGLALVNKIIERWGGRLEILSEDGKRGTTFRITMPLRQLKAVAAEQAVPPNQSPSERPFAAVARSSRGDEAASARGNA